MELTYELVETTENMPEDNITYTAYGVRAACERDGSKTEKTMKDVVISHEKADELLSFLKENAAPPNLLDTIVYNWLYEQEHV